MCRDRPSGFSLIELMITIAILAVLLAIGWPSFQGSLRSNRLATSTNELIATISLARSEAIRNVRGAAVCPSADGEACSASPDWNEGWLVWRDLDGNGAASSDEVLRYVQPKGHMQIVGPAAINFDSRGRVPAGVTTITLEPESCEGKAMRRSVQVRATGQVARSQELEECE